MIPTKIERINDNQIKCILTKEDLAARKISFRELTFGSAQANSLLRDMMQQASFQFGFEADDKPLMIEIVPMQSGMVVFVITKVVGNAPTGSDPEDEMDDIPFAEADESAEKVEEPAVSDNTAEQSLKNVPVPPVTPIARSIQDLLHEMFPANKNTSPKQAAVSENKENRCFVFNSLDNLFAASEALKDFACGDSALYKDNSTGDYYLLVHSKGLDAGEYKNLCMILSDFCTRSFKTGAYEAYVREHFKAVKESMALQALAKV
ncbi:MAG: adaptor protein MecA [Lachnospiraceae bacterium]|nr:adaptor protein MecA [Lachnospiraceae bacterium]